MSPGNAPNTGFPLRPMRVGEILAVAWQLARRHLAVLGSAALAASLLSSGVLLGILAATGSLTTYAEGAWVNDVLAGKTTAIPAPMLWAGAASALLSMICATVIAGVAAAYAANAAMGRPAGQGSLARLRGRWAALTVVAVCVAAIVALGLVALIIPGVVAYVALAVAAPVAVMEREPVGRALRRAASMTAGHRGRIFGALVVSVLVAEAASVAVSSVIRTLAGGLSPVGLTIASEGASAVVAALTGAWMASVIAVLYVDIRLRTEPLAARLAAAAGGTPGFGPGPGGFGVPGTGQPNG